MPIDNNQPVNKLKTIEDVQSAINTVGSSSSDSNIEASIFVGIDKATFIGMVNKSMAAPSSSDSIFYKNIDAAGAGNIFDALDKNKDGVLQEEEINEYAGKDGDSKSFSGTEIKVAIYDAITAALNTLGIENENIRDAAQSLLPTGSDYYEMQPSNDYSPPSNSGADKVYGKQDTPVNPYAGMKIEELKSEKTNIESNISTATTEVSTAEKDLSDKQTNLTTATAAFENAEKTLNEANLAMDEAVKNDTSVTDKQKTDIANIDKNLTAKETAITQNATEITNKESEITTTDTSIETTRSSISEKDGFISTAEASLSELNSQLSGISEGKTDDEKSKAKTQKDGIKKQISAKKDELNKLRNERKELETKRNELTTKKDSLKAELVTLKATKQTYETEKLGLVDQKAQAIATSCSPETKKIIDSFNKDIKAQYAKAQTEKVNAEKAVDDAKATLDAKKTKLDSLKDNLNKVNEQIVKRENSTMSEDLIEDAKKYLGYSETDRDKDYHLFTNGRDEAWCADFVSYVTKETYGADLPKGFGSASVNGLQQWGAKNNRTVGLNDVQAGNIMIQKNNASHTGIVTSVERNADGSIKAIHTIEGNSGDKVAERTYRPGDGRYEKISSYVNLN